MTLTLAFTRPLPFLPRTHVALIGDDAVIEANGYGSPKGVRLEPLYQFINDHPGVEIRSLAHPDPKSVWDAAMTQIGKPYDWGWYMAMLTRDRNWQSDQAWVCHELIAWACEVAGKRVIDWQAPRITPTDLYKLTSAYRS